MPADWTTATYAEAGFIAGTVLFFIGLGAVQIAKWWKRTGRKSDVG